MFIATSLYLSLKRREKIPRLFKAGLGVVTQLMFSFHLTFCFFELLFLKSTRTSLFGHYAPIERTKECRGWQQNKALRQRRPA